MKTLYNFTVFDNIDEFEKWLQKQKITRKITRLQVHHTYSPDYTTFEKTDKKVYPTNTELNRTKSFDDYGKKQWHSCDNYNHYIAQHFTIFPNGKITTGRNLNSTPIGIKGWNTNAICIEIYGNFDKDHMNSTQQNVVIAVYALLCEKFNITPSTTTIRPHCWFTSSGNYLGDYIKYKSAKTCPGTNFMNIGNTKSAFVNKFYPLIKNYINKNKSSNNSNNTKIKMVKNIYTEELNIRSTPNWSAPPIATLSPGDSITYISGPLKATGHPTKMYKCKNNTYITASPKYTKIIEV